jgi:pimeloyl-ACP methyl ester carboxylesterase
VTDVIYHRFVVLDGTLIHYTESGNGRDIMLLVHGLGASVVAWRKNISCFSTSHKVYAIDLPGHGDSGGYIRDYSVQNGVRILTEFITVLGLSRVTLVGNSLGGLLAMRVALDASASVGRLVLVSTVGLGRELSWYLRLASLPVVGTFLQNHTVVADRVVLRNIFHQSRSVEPDLIKEIMRVRNISQTRHTTLKIIRSGVSLRGLRSELQLVRMLTSLEMPILLIWGNEDRIVPVSQALLALRALPLLRLHVFKLCGHWPQMERFEEFNRLVLDFLKSA